MNIEFNFYSKEKQNRTELARLFPSQFSGKHISIGWPDGWHSIVKGVCESASQVAPHVQWLQIKDKFGGLRMYYPDGPLSIDLIDPAGRIATVVSGAQDALAPIVQAAKETSLRTCMTCGGAAQSYNNEGWIVTVCSDCLQKARRRNG